VFNESTVSKAYKGLFLSAILSLPRAWLDGGSGATALGERVQEAAKIGGI